MNIARMRFVNLTQTISMLDTTQFMFKWTDNLIEGQEIVGLFNNQNLVGLVKFEREVNFNYVLDIEVLPRYRGNGFGAMLLAIVMKDSFCTGGDGFVSLASKTDGTENFYLHLGASRQSFQ